MIENNRVDISDRKLVTKKIIDERNRDNGKLNIASRYK
jgi:hypothetical protein